MKSNGVDVEKRLFVYQVAAITHDGRAMAFVAQQTKAPFASRSLLVRPSNGSRIQ